MNKEIDKYKQKLKAISSKEEFPFFFIVGVTILGFLVLMFIQTFF
jgi:hypothetical protein